MTQGCRSMREILQPCYSAAGRTVARLRERRWWVAGFRSDSRISKQHVRILRTSLRAGPHYERRLPGDPMAMDGRSAGNAGAFSCRLVAIVATIARMEHATPACLIAEQVLRAAQVSVRAISRGALFPSPRGRRCRRRMRGFCHGLFRCLPNGRGPIKKGMRGGSLGQTNNMNWQRPRADG